jgi:hypothetical protein
VGEETGSADRGQSQIGLERSAFSIQTTFANSPESEGNIPSQRWRKQAAAMYIPPAVQGGSMLKKEIVRDGRNKIIGSVTSGFADDSAVVRDEHGQIVGRT